MSEGGLRGRVILVTGASSGVGRRMSVCLAREGASVALAARRADLLEDVQREITSAGGMATALTMDVASEASVIAGFDRIEGEIGPVDSLVANAGLNVAGGALDLAVSDFDRITAVNLRGVFLTAREAARRMIKAGSVERGHGRIVITSSITASHVSPGTGPYSASKAGVTQLGRVLARDWARKGINVNTLAPGYMVTELTEEWLLSPGGQQQLAGYPRRRAMSVGALDSLLLYLCSDASAEVTGSVFTVDDGQTL